MLRYLEHGWYEEKGKNRLRKEVIDGAMDAAGFLVRAEVSVDKLMLVALKIRSLVAIIDPLVGGSRKFGKVDREMIMVRLEPHLASCDAFEGFVADCLETVSGPHD
ncbi:hypothetical protein KAI87_08675, partial [Myxococcota bacterium]|nr:hypothetical protein [Myxococcota bacterium]